jgi:hypothetical protein
MPAPLSPLDDVIAARLAGTSEIQGQIRFVLGVVAVISTWLLPLTRRDNYIVGFLLRETADPNVCSTEQRWKVFHSIATRNLFISAVVSEYLDGLRR